MSNTLSKVSITLLKGKALAKAIKSIAATSKELQKNIHLVAMSVCVEAVNTGNLTHMIHFDAAVEHVGRRAVRRWLDKHGPAKWDVKESTFKFDDARRKKIVAMGADKYAESLAAGPSYIDETTKADTDSFHAFDVLGILKSIVRKHDKVADPNDSRHSFVGYDDVVKLINKLEPMRAETSKPASTTKPAKKAAPIRATADGELLQ